MTGYQLIKEATIIIIAMLAPDIPLVYQIAQRAKAGIGIVNIKKTRKKLLNILHIIRQYLLI